MGDGLEVNWIVGIGILLSIVGICLIIVGGVIWSQTEVEYTWYGPIKTHPNEDLGMTIAQYGIFALVLGVPVIAVGFVVLKLRERRKQKGLVPVPKPPN